MEAAKQRVKAAAARKKEEEKTKVGGSPCQPLRPLVRGSQEEGWREGRAPIEKGVCNFGREAS